MAQMQKIIPLRGGLDLVTPAMLVTPGFCVASLNYEVEARGYRRAQGFERTDGQPRPSDAEYYMLDFDVGVTAILEDDVITGLTSGATAIALIDATLDSGTWAGGDGVGTLVLYNVVGTFQNNEALQVSAATVATSAGTVDRNGASTDALHATYIASVTSKRRAAIAKPTGSGAILGVATYNGSKYCWRNNAGGTAAVMFKATTAGWVAQTLSDYILFTGGTTEFTEGETITGTTSTFTAVVRRVALLTGAWDGSGTGMLVISGATGAFNASEAITSAGGSATTNGTQASHTLPAGGAYHALQDNFYGQSTGTRLYVVNGVGRAYEWDGTYSAICFTGLSDALDKPTYVAVQRFHLFLAYVGGSLLNSSTGLPLSFNAITGAGEIGFGQDPTGLKSNTKDSMIITGRNKVGYLVGSETATFELRALSEDSGGIANTLEVVGQPLFMDDRGIRDLKATQSYGDWTMGTVSRLVEPLLRSKKLAGITPVGAMRVRTKDQYRIYFSDGTGVVVYFGRKTPEIMAVNNGITPTCMASGEDSDGNEILLQGADDGWVYELDRGTSLDGTAMEAFIRFSWLNLGSPNRMKRFHRARLEGQAGDENTALDFLADFNYGGDEQPASGVTSFTMYGNGGFWDELTWNEFTWSSQVEGQAFAPMDGIGENVSIVIDGTTSTETPHTLSTLTINFTPRRMLR